MNKTKHIIKFIAFILSILLLIAYETLIFSNEEKYYLGDDKSLIEEKSFYWILGFQVVVFILIFGKNLLKLKSLKEFGLSILHLCFIGLLTFYFFRQTFSAVILPLNRTKAEGNEISEFRVLWKNKKEDRYSLTLYELNQQNMIWGLPVDKRNFESINARDTIKLQFKKGIIGIRFSPELIEN